MCPASAEGTTLGKITITSGPDGGKEYPLADSQVLGRIGRCSITLKDTRASREHARIYKSRDTYFVTDLNSKNGIQVNDEKVKKAQLSPGDRVLIGETWVRVDFEPETFDPPVTEAPTPHGPPARGTRDIKVRGGTGVSAEPIRTGAHGLPKGGRSQHNITRTSLAWLRTDLAQVSGLYRVMLLLGLVLLAGGLGYLTYLAVVG
jgi:pSer/pThr/pTyr-binding forkhead associated (FHA) protein